ncbi:hypothetical protein P7C71_g4057, partial [Lecanoromycetidae sp. Uapishka_2]
MKSLAILLAVGLAVAVQAQDQCAAIAAKIPTCARDMCLRSIRRTGDLSYGHSEQCRRRHYVRHGSRHLQGSCCSKKLDGCGPGYYSSPCPSD